MNTSHVFQQIKTRVESHLAIQARELFLTLVHMHFHMFLNVVLVSTCVSAIQTVIWFLAGVRVNVSLEVGYLVGTKIALVTDVFELVQVWPEHVSASLAMINDLCDIVCRVGLAVFARVLVSDGRRVVWKHVSGRHWHWGHGHWGHWNGRHGCPCRENYRW